MCGYIGNLHDAPGVIDLLDELGITLPLPYYQAYPRRLHPALITLAGDQCVLSKATWWYALKRDGDKLVPNPDVTSFNARHLHSRLWHNAINRRRGIVLATELGESKGNKHYLMRSKDGIAIGAVYKDWNAPGGEVVRSMAIITRPPHPRFARYHDQSIPAFLPLDKATLDAWLDPMIESTHPAIADILETPRLYTDFSVTEVKTFKRAEALTGAKVLPAD